MHPYAILVLAGGIIWVYGFSGREIAKVTVAAMLGVGLMMVL